MVRPSGDAILAALLVYTLLAFYAAAIYTVTLVLGGVTRPTDHAPWWLELLALTMIVLTVRPVHRWLRRAVNLLVYGEHDNPYAVIAQVSRHLDGHAAPDTIVPAVVETIAATLKLPYVAIATNWGGETQTVAYGCPPAQGVLTPILLSYGGDQLGVLYAATRRPDEALSPADLKLLGDLARQVGITLYAARLGDALQNSREQLVTAREEERRRIRRELHDNLGPTLAALRLQLAAVRTTLREQPEQAAALVEELRDDVRAATADLRRVIYDLRPPQLDEHGLVGALRTLSQVAEGAAFTLEVPEQLPPLTAAVEVAVYRIAAEAVHNVAKHARAARCCVQLAVIDGTLRLTVEDDEVGSGADRPLGVGRLSMRERAAELGGRLDFSERPTGGTRVTAVIPCRSAA